jgi:ribosome-associated toxin RatA of RatAB toxin-antitoxin module
MTSGTSTAVEEHIVVAAPATEVFAAVADVRRMARWSPECFAVWIWRRQNGTPARFIGWNRNGPFIWFSSCQVRVADPGVEFAFDVTKSATIRPEVNREGMRETLHRLKSELESRPQPAAKKLR